MPGAVLPPLKQSISPIAFQEGPTHTELKRDVHRNCGIAVFQRHPPRRVASAETATRPIRCPTTARFRQAGNSERFTNRHKKTIHIQTTSLPPRRFFYGENNDEITGKTLLDGSKTPKTSTREMKAALGELRDYLSALLGTDSDDKAAAREALGIDLSMSPADIIDALGLYTL